MCNRTVVAKALVIAGCTLAIALSTIGMGVNSSWAGADRASGLNFTPISTDMVERPAPRPMRADRIQRADVCFKSGERPGAGNLCYKCCSGGCRPGTETAPICQ
jgi:hypothetical protein